LILTKRDQEPTKADAVGSSGARSQTKRRAEAERKGAPSRVKQTHEFIDTSRSGEQRAALRSISGSDDRDFALNLIDQVLAAAWREGSSSDERQTAATLAAMYELKPRDPIGE
jgi:hypothetical protein